MDPKGLIRFYNALVSLMVEGRFRPSYGRRGGFKQHTAANLKSAAQLLAWLEEKGYEVRPYITGCFASHNWCYQPKWDRLKQARRYQKFYEAGEAWRWWEVLEREDRFAEKPEGLHPGHEIIKARHFHTEEVDAVNKYSGVLRDLGWSCYYTRMAGRFREESQFCQRCSYRERCR